MIPLRAGKLQRAFQGKGKVALGEEEAEKIGEPVKNAHKEGKDAPLSLEEKRKIFGEHLRNTREQLNQTKKDVIHLTRISPPFIEALEDGKFEALPGEVFGRGFVKNICKVLEIDATPLLEEYNQCWEHKQVKARSYGYSRRLTSGRKDHKSKSLPFTNYFSLKGIILWVLGPAVLVSLAFLLYFNAGSLKTSFSRKEPTPQSQSKKMPSKSVDQQPQLIEQTNKAEQSTEDTAKVHADSESAKKSAESRNEQDSKEITANIKPNKQATSDVIKAPTEEKTPIIEIAPKGFSLTGNSQKYSSLMVLVKEKASIKYRFDQGNYESKEYKKGLYKFKFKDKIDLFSDDMSKLEVTFNGRKLGEFGINRDAKQLSFIGNSAEEKKL